MKHLPVLLGLSFQAKPSLYIYITQNESRPPAAPQAQERRNTDQQSQSERPASIHAIRTFNPSYAEATASNVGGNIPQEGSNNQQSKN